MWQHEAQWWGIFIPPLTLGGDQLYFVAAVAETKRMCLSTLPEGESELVGGYLTEYSGMKFGMFFMGEFVEMSVSLARHCLGPVLRRMGCTLPLSCMVSNCSGTCQLSIAADELDFR